MATSSESPRSKLIKGTTYSFSATILAKIALVVSSIIVARLLGSTQLGVLAILNSILSMVNLPAGLGISGALVKYTAEYDAKRKERLNSLISTAMTIISLTAGVTAIALILISNNVASDIYREPAIAGMLIIAAVSLFINVIASPLIAILQGFQKIKELSLRNIISTFIAIPVTIALVIVWGLWGAVVGLVTTAIIGLIVNIRLVGKLLRIRGVHVRPMIDRTEVKRIFNYAIPLFFTGLVVAPVSAIVLTILQWNHDFGAIGLYYVANALAGSLLLIPVAISVPMVPLMSELDVMDKEKLRTVSSKVIHMTFIFFLPLTIALAVFSRLIIGILYGEAFIDAWRVLYLLSIGSFLIAIDNVIVCVLLGTGRIWVSFGLNSMWMIFFVSGSILLIPPFAEVGLGLAYLIAYVVYTTGVLFYAHKKLGVVLQDIEIIFPIAAFGYGLCALPLFMVVGLPSIIFSALVMVVILVATIMMFKDYEWEFIHQSIRKITRRKT